MTVTDTALPEAPRVAVILTGVFAATGRALTVNDAEDEPAGMMTDAGTDNAVLSPEVSNTSVSTAAGPVKVIVAAALVFAFMTVLVRVTRGRLGACTVRVVVTILPFDTALIVTGVSTTTGMVVTANVAVVAPAGTITESARAMEGSLPVKFTVVGTAAGLVNVTVPVAPLPPTTFAGSTVTLESTGAITFSVAVLAAAPDETEIVAVTSASTACVPTSNVADDSPALTVTVGGTVTASLSLIRLKLVGTAAGPVSVTVPIADAPPGVVVLLSLRNNRAGASALTAADFDTPPEVAVILTTVSASTEVTAIWNAADVAPAGSNTLGDTTAAELSLASVTVVSVNAGAEKVTFPVIVLGPVTLAGTATDDSRNGSMVTGAVFETV